MSQNEPWSSDSTGAASKQLRASMHKIDVREWWLWLSAMMVTILLALAIVSFALPALFFGLGFSALFLDDGVRGLLGMVMIFNIYAVYEQMQIHRIRREFADRLYELGVLDPLTSLFNRRFIEHRLQEEIARCQRHGTPLTIILFDLDGFKRINDGHGHPAGDDFLKAFAERLKKATRGSDVAARYGGDEFLAVLPECKAEEVQFVLRRLSGLQVEINGEPVSVRYSVGCTNYVPGESVAALLKRADDALYVNKRRPKELPVPVPVAVTE